MRVRSLLMVVLTLSAVPTARAQQTPAQRERALTAIRALGGEVVMDETKKEQKEKPIIRVDLHGPRVTDQIMEHIRGFTYLQTLDLSGTRVTDAGLENIKAGKLQKLHNLQLNYTAVTDAGLRSLIDLEDLEVLGLSYTDITGAGLARLRLLKRLRVLALSGTGVDDASLAQLKKLPRLTTLYLDDTQITRAGLAQLKDLPLQILSYSGTKAVVDGDDGFFRKQMAP
jgi:Leucine Rich repeat